MALNTKLTGEPLSVGGVLHWNAKSREDTRASDMLL